jgi:chromosome segregation ATPase
MSYSEEIQALLDDVLPRLDALKENALQEIEEAQDRAETSISRHEQATVELSQVEAEISSLKQERESLPGKAYRAGLDEDWQEEDRLKERYRTLKPALEELEERRESLRQELHSLNPAGDDYPGNATLHQYAQVARVAHGPRTELEALKEKLSKALDDSLDPVIAKHESLRATTWQLSHDRAWATSPVGRGGIR